MILEDDSGLPKTVLSSSYFPNLDFTDIFTPLVITSTARIAPR